jgi:hypothetical protein
MRLRGCPVFVDNATAAKLSVGADLVSIHSGERQDSAAELDARCSQARGRGRFR